MNEKSKENTGLFEAYNIILTRYKNLKMVDPVFYSC
jgi:hypothetical protein